MFFIEARATLRQLLPAAKWGVAGKLWLSFGCSVVRWLGCAGCPGDGGVLVAPQSVLHKYENIQFTSVTNSTATTQCCLLGPATGTPQTHSRGGISLYYIKKHIHIRLYTYEFPYIFTRKVRKNVIIRPLNKINSWAVVK